MHHIQETQNSTAQRESTKKLSQFQQTMKTNSNRQPSIMCIQFTKETTHNNILAVLTT